MALPHFSYFTVPFSLVLCAVGASTGIELFFHLGIAFSGVSLVIVLIQGFRD